MNASTKSQEPEIKRTACEVYSRVVGYIRPVNQWNDGKREEFSDRTSFQVPNCL
jgi:ribonucleoside-triphosphate reductase